jgi:Fe-S-cluster containining protein
MLSNMESSLTDTLCTRCGMCCDGSLFADVELVGRAEAAGLEVMGLEVEDDDASGRLLVQPCRALRDKRCRIYAHRPQCCRTFECRLLQEVRSGVVRLDRAKEHIAQARERIGRVKGLLTRLGQRDVRLPLRERCVEALAGGAGVRPEVARTRLELEAAMRDLEASIRRTFLGDEVRTGPRKGR